MTTAFRSRLSRANGHSFAPNRLRRKLGTLASRDVLKLHRIDLDMCVVGACERHFQRIVTRCAKFLSRGWPEPRAVAHAVAKNMPDMIACDTCRVERK